MRVYFVGKMSALKYICFVFIAIGAASGEEVKNVFGVLGGKVSFGSTSLPPPVSSIIWKHRSSTGPVIKAIEWDTDDGVTIPNPRFKEITTLDKQTGQITITKLNVEHSGLYTIDINSKEQEQKYNLSFMEPVPKPVITIDRADKNSLVVYLICEYSDTIIWNNTAGEKLDVQDHHPKGKFIIVKKNGNPENYYTCTLKNAVSEKTSDPVYERDLFEESGSVWIVLIVLFLLLIAPFIVFVPLYKFWPKFHDSVNTKFKGKPCIGGFLNLLDGKNNIEEGKQLEEGAVKRNGDEKKPDEDKPNENLLKEDSETLN